MGSKQPTPNPGKCMLCGLPNQRPAPASGVATALMGSLPCSWEKAGQRSRDRAQSLGNQGAPDYIPCQAAHHVSGGFYVPHLQSTPGDTQSQLAPARRHDGGSPGVRPQVPEPGGLHSPPPTPHGLGTLTPAHLHRQVEHGK